MIKRLAVVTLLTLTTGSALAIPATSGKNQPYTTAECKQFEQDQPNILSDLKNAANDEARKHILAQLLAVKPGAAVCVMGDVKSGAPSLTLNIFQTMIGLLATDPDNNQPVIDALTGDNPDLVAQIAQDVEPAAGPDGNPDPGNTGPTAPLENPGQLSANQP